MNKGDIVVNVQNSFRVEYVGKIGGNIHRYQVVEPNGWESFTGTHKELLIHCANKLEAQHKHDEMFGNKHIKRGNANE